MGPDQGREATARTKRVPLLLSTLAPPAGESCCKSRVNSETSCALTNLFSMAVSLGGLPSQWGSAGRRLFKDYRRLFVSSPFDPGWASGFLQAHTIIHSGGPRMGVRRGKTTHYAQLLLQKQQDHFLSQFPETKQAGRANVLQSSPFPQNASPNSHILRVIKQFGNIS